MWIIERKGPLCSQMVEKGGGIEAMARFLRLRNRFIGNSLHRTQNFVQQTTQSTWLFRQFLILPKAHHIFKKKKTNNLTFTFNQVKLSSNNSWKLNESSVADNWETLPRLSPETGEREIRSKKKKKRKKLRWWSEINSAVKFHEAKVAPGFF